MTAPPVRRFVVRWSDADANGHLKNTAYSEYGNDARIALFASIGWPWTRFRELRLGPILFREELAYQREAAIGEEVLVSTEVAGLAPDASRWSMVHRLWKTDGTEMARIVLHGSFMDLEARRTTAPPRDLADALRALPRGDDFAELPAIRRR